MKPTIITIFAGLLLWGPVAAAQNYVTGTCSTTTIVTGGTATTAINGPYNGFYIYNPPTATGQGIATAEDLFVDTTNAATTTGNGTNSELVSGQSFSWGIGSASNSVSVNAATSGHKFTCERW